MNGTTKGAFGDPLAVRRAQAANRAYARAIKLEYNMTSAKQFARVAHKEASLLEDPELTAARVVIPKTAVLAGGGKTG